MMKAAYICFQLKVGLMAFRFWGHCVDIDSRKANNKRHVFMMVFAIAISYATSNQARYVQETKFPGTASY